MTDPRSLLAPLREVDPALAPLPPAPLIARGRRRLLRRRLTGMATGVALAIAVPLLVTGIAQDQSRTDEQPTVASGSIQIPLERPTVVVPPTHRRLEKDLLALGVPEQFTDGARLGYSGGERCFDSCPSVHIVATGPADMTNAEALRAVHDFLMAKNLIRRQPTRKDWTCEAILEDGHRGPKFPCDFAPDVTLPSGNILGVSTQTYKDASNESRVVLSVAAPKE